MKNKVSFLLIATGFSTYKTPLQAQHPLIFILIIPIFSIISHRLCFLDQSLYTEIFPNKTLCLVYSTQNQTHGLDSAIIDSEKNIRKMPANL